MEIYRGHIFINFSKEGPGVASMMGPIDAEVAVYAPEGYEPIGEPIFQVWECNWKLALGQLPGELSHSHRPPLFAPAC